MKRVKNVTVIVYLNKINDEYIKHLEKNYEKAIILYPEIFKSGINSKFKCMPYSPGECKASALNRAVSTIHDGWVLYLNDNEELQTSELMPEKGKVYAALIYHSGKNNISNKFYDVRLFPAIGKDIFKGNELPDLFETCIDNDWEMADEYITISRTANDEIKIDPDIELASYEKSGKASLIKAVKLTAEQKNNQASKYFNAAIKSDKLFKYDFTAALNGLADLLVEQNNWQEAAQKIHMSISAEPEQRMPYLVLYKIAYLKKDWNGAINALEQYLNYHDSITKSNFDVQMSKDECHFLIGDAAFKIGDYSKAFYNYEQYYQLNDGNIDKEIIEKLFIYSIELSDYERSVHYFMDLFGEFLSQPMSESKYSLVHDALSLFMDKGWTDFACSIYENIYQYRQGDEMLLRRWVAALIKGKNINKAKWLITQENTFSLGQVAM